MSRLQMLKSIANRYWYIALIVWTSIAIFHYAQFYLQHINSGRPFLWLPTLAEFIVNYYTWVFIAVIIYWLGRRYKVRRSNWAKTLPVHFTASVLLGVFHIGIITAMLKLCKYFEYPSSTFFEIYLYTFLQLFHFEVLMYWVVLGLCYGFDHYARNNAWEVSTGNGSENRNQFERAFICKLPVKNNSQTLFLQTDQIDWIEAADNYVNIYAGKRSFLLREKISVLHEKLDPQHFQRIHRSTIVNLSRVEKLRRLEDGHLLVVLRNDKTLRVSRGWQQQLQKSLHQIQ